MVISNTCLKILSLFLSNPTKDYNIRELSLKSKLNYRLAYQEVMSLVKNKIILLEKKGTVNVCNINLSGDISLYSYIESLRSEEFQRKHTNFKVIIKELSKLSTSYYTIIAFGSYVKRTEQKKSDIDLLFVIPKTVDVEAFEKEVAVRLKLLTYPIDINVINEDSFLEMKKTSELNLVNEIIKNHIILFGAENYYRLLTK